MKSHLVFVISLVSAISASAITVDTVPVGNPGNFADTRYNSGGLGSVAYDFRMGKTEVTNAQYVQFLNAVAATDPFQLYRPSMTSSTWGGIVRSGSSGSYSYAVKPLAAGQGPGGTDYSYDNKPVVYVTWYSGLRFANWLHNGQLTGAEDSTTTEGGAYTFSGATTVGPRNAAATWWLPNLNEWYKAAYYDPITPHYYNYPTRSDFLQPDNNLPTNDTGNSANFTFGNTTTGSSAYPFTDAGAYELSASGYGTHDQGGNAREWTESIAFSTFLSIRGGSWADGGNDLTPGVYDIGQPGDANEVRGFRLARKPFVALSGDFNGDGTVDAADYVVWRHNNGPSTDYDLWRSHYGQSVSGSGSSAESASIPEPSSVALIMILGVILLLM
jgi:sulfatase modifying factor 1